MGEDPADQQEIEQLDAQYYEQMFHKLGKAKGKHEENDAEERKDEPEERQQE